MKEARLVQISESPLNPNFEDLFSRSLYANNLLEKKYTNLKLFSFKKNVFIEDFFCSQEEQVEFERDYWDQNFYHKKDCKKIYSIDDFYKDLESSKMDKNVFTSFQNSAPFTLDSDEVTSNSKEFESLNKLQNTSSRLLEFDRFSKSTVCKKIRQKIQKWTNSYTHITAFYSNKGQSVIPFHWDTENLFIYQAHGSKTWIVARPDLEKPLKLHNPGALKGHCNDIESDGFKIKLKEGDLLYVPRGWFHKATAEDEESLHITFGISTPTVLDYAINTISNSLFTLSKNKCLRELFNPEDSRDGKKVLSEIVSDISKGIENTLNKNFVNEYNMNFPLGRREFSSENYGDAEKIIQSNLAMSLINEYELDINECDLSGESFLYFEGHKLYLAKEDLEQLIKTASQDRFYFSEIDEVIGNKEISFKIILLLLMGGDITF